MDRTVALGNALRGWLPHSATRSHRHVAQLRSCRRTAASTLENLSADLCALDRWSSDRSPLVEACPSHQNTGKTEPVASGSVRRSRSCLECLVNGVADGYGKTVYGITHLTDAYELFDKSRFPQRSSCRPDPHMPNMQASYCPGAAATVSRRPGRAARGLLALRPTPPASPKRRGEAGVSGASRLARSACTPMTRRFKVGRAGLEPATNGL